MQLLTRRILQDFARKSSFSNNYLKFSSKAIQNGNNIVANQCDSNKTTSHHHGTITNPQNLPHFPVQSLTETIPKFLKTIEVHLTPQELLDTERSVQDFQNGIGRKLQNLLENQSKKEENWLASRWLKAAYLTYRDPVCVFSSPGMAFPTQKFNSNNDYLEYTSKVIYAALKYKEMIDLKKIPLEKMGKNELDMSQYEKIFGTCRIPGVKEDSLEYHPNSKHIAVIYKNHFYKFPVYTKCDELLSPKIINEQLQSIMDKNVEKNPNGIGILTSDDRDSWGLAYQELIQNSDNRKSVNEIQKSLFVVCLDQEVPINHGVNDMTVVSEQLIHGGGSNQNAGNRWFDKTIQIAINRNGVNGFCYEHSPAEGQPIAIMTDYIIKSITDPKLGEGSSSSNYDQARKLDFIITDKLKDYIEHAKENVNKLANDLHMEVIQFKGYGKEFIKSQKLSPDSYIQMAMQYAFYKLHKTPAAHYESAHLRMYINGRTETIRSCSNESIEFAKSMLNSNCSDNERVKLLKNAVNAHRDYTLMALQGKGVDRHLLGLKLMAIENNLDIPELYKTSGFIKSSHFRLSTSQVASKYEAFMCYGPLTNDGYGCCYNPRSNDIIFAISSWSNNPITDTNKFSISMQESLQSMSDLLYRAGEKPKSKI